MDNEKTWYTGAQMEKLRREYGALEAERDYLADQVLELQGYKPGSHTTGTSSKSYTVPGIVNAGDPPVECVPAVPDKSRQTARELLIKIFKVAGLDAPDECVPAVPDMPLPKRGDLIRIRGNGIFPDSDCYVESYDQVNRIITIAPPHKRLPDLGHVPDCKTDDDMTIFDTVEEMIASLDNDTTNALSRAADFEKTQRELDLLPARFEQLVRDVSDEPQRIPSRDDDNLAEDIAAALANKFPVGAMPGTHPPDVSKDDASLPAIEHDWVWEHGAETWLWEGEDE